MDKKTYMAADLEVKDADQGLVQAEFATLNVIDLDGDVTLPGAFGDQRVKLAAWGHNWGDLPVGKGGISEQGEKAVFDGKFFLDTTAGLEHFKTVKNLGALQEWSYGFEVKQAVRRGQPEFDAALAEGYNGPKPANVERILQKMKVFEVSPVMRGAGINTRTRVVKDADDQADEAPEGTPWRELVLSEHADFVIKEAQTFLERCQSVTEELDQEGRLLSESKRDRLHQLGKALESVRDEMAALLKRTEQPTPERLLGLRDQFERIEARIERLGAK